MWVDDPGTSLAGNFNVGILDRILGTSADVPRVLTDIAGPGIRLAVSAALSRRKGLFRTARG